MSSFLEQHLVFFFFWLKKEHLVLLLVEENNTCSFFFSETKPGFLKQNLVFWNKRTASGSWNKQPLFSWNKHCVSSFSWNKTCLLFERFFSLSGSWNKQFFKKSDSWNKQKKSGSPCCSSFLRGVLLFRKEKEEPFSLSGSSAIGSSAIGSSASGSWNKQKKRRAVLETSRRREERFLKQAEEERQPFLFLKQTLLWAVLETSSNEPLKQINKNFVCFEQHRFFEFFSRRKQQKKTFLFSLCFFFLNKTCLC